MRKNSIVKILSVLLVIGMLFSVAPLSVTAENAAPQQAVVVEQAVLEEIQTNGSAGYVIRFKNDADLSLAHTMNWSDRGWFVYNTLKAQQENSQKAALNYLTNAGVKYQAFWIDNTIHVENSDSVVLNAIQTFDGVESINAPKLLPLPQVNFSEGNQTMAVEPNISRVGANRVWDELDITGEGYTIANIDTGVHYTHDALVNQYRGNEGGTFNHDYNWFDGYSTLTTPSDLNGHGSHTMGTMVGADASGTNQIGMAPGAQWMACRGCATTGCAGSALTACAQFMAAPTKVDGTLPNPDLRPVAVNNSWGDCDQAYDPWYQGVVDAWVDLGILPSFSNGNASNCDYPNNPPLETVGNPARYGNVSGVGSTGQSNGAYANHSNKGPSDVPDNVNPVDGHENVKPQFMAPGVSVRSSIPSGNSAYGGATGTSMSAPHVTGLVALIRQAAPCISDYGLIETLIQDTAKFVDEPAGFDEGTVPNNSVGWGEIDAFAAVSAALGMCGNNVIEGTVKSDAAGNPPIADAKVVISPEDGAARTVRTNAEGKYTANVTPGTYTLVASKLGYVSSTKTATIEENQEEPEVVHFVLEALPAREITGTVTDGGVIGGEVHGYPLMATLTFAAADHTLTATSDPFTGKYKITVYDNEEYTITVQAAVNGYMPATRDIDGDSAAVQDFALNVKPGACVAPGYQGAGTTEGFDNGLPTGWTIQQYGTGGQWHFDDPKGRGNRTGGEGIFAMVDSDYYGSGNVQNTGLRTPTMNFTDAAGALVEFKSYFYKFYGQTAKVRYSLDGGETWVNIVELPSTTEQKDYSFDMSDEFSGQATVIVEFLFQASWDYYWQIDDVKISDGSCSKLAGGAVAGYAYDANEEDVKLTGVKFETEQNSYVSQENDFEPANGLYWFFEETTADPQDVEFTVSKSKYTTTIEDVSVAQGELTRKDFELGSPKFVVSPESLERTIPLGDDDEYDTIYVKNIGTGAAYGNWSLRESDMGFVPLSIPAFTGELEPMPAESLTTEADLSTSTTQVKPELSSFLSKPIALFGGSLAYANEVRSNDTLYRVPDLEIPGTWESVAPIAVTYYAGDFLRSDFSKIYAVSDTDNFVTIDTATGAVTPIGPLSLPSGLSSVQGISGGPGFFYGSSSNCSSYTAIFTITPEGTTELVANTPIACGIDIAYAPDKNMIFVVDIVSDHLYSYDLASGETTDIGALGFNAGYAQGMDYDEANKILYWAAYGSGGNGQLRVIDTTTGASELVGPFPGDNEVAFLAIAAGGAGGGAVPWLDEDPVDGYVAPGEQFPVQITFSVKDIEQPGDYFAELRFTTDTPYEVAPIPVTMHVLRPFTWGNIKGTVIASEKCDINPAPLAEATVNFYKDGELFKSTTTDENGYYSYSLERGTYDVEIVSAEHVASRVNDVVVPVSDDVVVDFNLRHNSPCLSYEPEMLFAQLYPDQTTDKILTFRNTGAVDAVFEMAEVPGEGPVPYGASPNPVVEHVAPRKLNIPEYTGPELVHTTPPSMDLKPSSKAPAGGPALTLSGSAKDFGINAVVPAYGNHVFETDLGVYKWPDVAVPGTWEKIGPHLEKAYAGDFLGSDFSKLYVVDDDTKQLISVSTTDAAQTVIATITPPSGRVAGLSGAEGFFYGVTSNCGNDSTLFKMTPTGEVEVLGGIPSSTCAIDLAYIPSEGMIYIVDIVDGKLHKVDPANPAGSEAVGSGLGYMPKYAQSMDYDEVNGILYWAACNDDDFAQLRVIDITTGNSTKIGDFNSSEVTAFGVAGGGGGGTPGDIPWLELDSNAGVALADGGEVEITATFDSTGLTWGDYFGQLRVTNAPDPRFNIPVQLRVQPFNMMYLPVILRNFN